MLRRMSRERFLSDSELERLFQVVRARRHVNQPRDYCLLALLANTGIRPSEALALTRDDVHPHARPPWIILNRTKKPHGPHPNNELILHPKVARVVAAHADTLSAGQPLFDFTKRQLARVFKFYAIKSGLGAYRIYALRHSVGMRLWRHTKDLRVIQAILGHSHLGPAHAYIHVPQERIVQMYRELGTIG